MDQDQPPGFRFYPTEEELISFYLQHKLEGGRQDLLIDRVIPVQYIYQFNPWELPDLAGERCRGDSEQWFFFIPRQEREASGGRPNRLTLSGYWKATGSPGFVYSSGNRIIGVKRTMVFYRGRAPAGRKTEWKMNEYRAIDGEASSSTNNAVPKLRQEFSLCRVYKKSKCLRTFDRRPAMAAAGEASANQAHRADEASSSSHPSHAPREIGTNSPGESSSSGDHANNPCQTAGSAGSWDLAGADIDEPMWDWDQLNWF